MREALNIGMVGLGELQQKIMITILCRAELGPWVRGRPAVGYISSQGNGALLWAHGTDRWLIVHAFPAARGERPEDFTSGRCLDLARRAVGIPALPVEQINTPFCRRAAQGARGVRGNRVILAGAA